MSDKCRGCGTDLWELTDKRDPMRGSHSIHNEANCLASRLDTEMKRCGEATRLASEYKADRDALGLKLYELENIEKAHHESIDETDFFADRLKETEAERNELQRRLGEVRSDLWGMFAHYAPTVLSKHPNDGWLIAFCQAIEAYIPTIDRAVERRESNEPQFCKVCNFARDERCPRLDCPWSQIRV